jgi:hypothetical protein
MNQETKMMMIFNSTRKVFLLTLVSIMLVCSCGTNEKKTDNIRAFSKLYGYVRWFHPSDEAQQIDWDKFAIYGVIPGESKSRFYAIL